MKEINVKQIIENEDEESIDKEIEKFKAYIQKVWKNSKPLAKLFKTSSGGYIYDTGTNKIMACDECVYFLLESMFSMDIDSALRHFTEKYEQDHFYHAIATLKNSIDNDKILLTHKAEQFGLSDHYRDYKELIQSSLEILFLEVTTGCNCRCTYCVYNAHVKEKRIHGEINMKLPVALRSIEYLHDHSFKNENVYIAFYGGEPLLAFPLIKSCVRYVGKIFKKRKVKFSLTTNATCITKDIAKFLFENEFKVLVSIDGPEEIHNRYRIYPDGSGCYDDAINGFKNLVEAYNETSKENLSLSMVYTPPFSGGKIDRIAKLWEELPWIPEDIGIAITYPSRGTIPSDVIVKSDLVEDKNLQQWAFEKFLEKRRGKGNSHPIANSIIEKGLAMLMQRPIFQDLFNQYYLNGCCVPGVRRLYVSTEGKFHVCERISTMAPTIGDVQSGIDFDVIKKIYIRDYESLSIPVCSKCWAIRLCTSCYTGVFKEGKFDLETKLKNCHSVKKSQERFLEYYCTLMEEDPYGLDYLYDYKLT